MISDECNVVSINTLVISILMSQGREKRHRLPAYEVASKASAKATSPYLGHHKECLPTEG